ncbi:hypothetical protein DMA15_10275 [Streptomyces sp. WAC 01529]|uniref:hypothetical protein n=1 Tax=Streptomyces sp. WAC 01529 TaxID=2203205 RepID=UPI000F6EFA84|nr:hypothetical protein [Streptomyces sp. WAC 01529]AZM52936.1 hypothetical protein DMA15_10275 [Streptomyces sp. WAC 01529]
MSKARRLRGLCRPVAVAATVTALSVTATGCVTVHGEREVLPTATKAEAAKALKDFLTAYNKADKAYDPALDAARITGPLGAINQGGLKARHAQYPEGNPKHVPLVLTDVKYSIPKKAGWPRWFMADTKASRRSDLRWLWVFTKSGPDALWRATYLNLVAPQKVPRLKKDKDGWAEPVGVGAEDLAIAPSDLGERYTSFLKAGGKGFAPGDHTTRWKALRDKNSKRAGLVVQYIDEPRNGGPFAPLGLRTEDGGALVFFSTHHYEKQTAAKGLSPRVDANAKALLKGEVRQSLLLTRAGNQVAVDPKKSGGDRVTVLGRMQGLTGAKGDQ